MNDDTYIRIPTTLAAIETETVELEFDMPSERRTGALLRTLAASRRNSQILELGTGTGLATSWLLDGMDTSSSLLSIDNNSAAMEIAKRHLGHDDRVEFLLQDANVWLDLKPVLFFDLIFADTMPGKYENFETAWSRLSAGGQYIIDDMLPQANWPEGHDKKVAQLLSSLERRADCILAKLGWSSGVVIAVKTG